MRGSCRSIHGVASVVRQDDDLRAARGAGRRELRVCVGVAIGSRSPFTISTRLPVRSSSGWSCERHHRGQQYRAAERLRVAQQQRGRDVGAVGEADRHPATRPHAVLLLGGGEERGELVGARAQVVLVEHALAEPAEEPGIPFSSTVPRGDSTGRRGRGARAAEAGRARPRLCRAATAAADPVARPPDVRAPQRAPVMHARPLASGSGRRRRRAAAAAARPRSARGRAPATAAA